MRCIKYRIQWHLYLTLLQSLENLTYSMLWVCTHFACGSRTAQYRPAAQSGSWARVKEFAHLSCSGNAHGIVTAILRHAHLRYHRHTWRADIKGADMAAIFGRAAEDGWAWQTHLAAPGKAIPRNGRWRHRLISCAQNTATGCRTALRYRDFSLP